MNNESTQTATVREFRWKYWYSVKTVLILGFIFLAILIIPDLLFIIFGGLLFSVFLASISSYLQAKSHLRYSICLVITLILLTIFFVCMWYFLAPSLAEQFDQLSQDLPKAFAEFTKNISQFQWGRYVIQEADPKNIIQNSPDLLKNATNAFSNVFEWITNIFIMTLIGIYIAFEPSIYKNGLLKLFPPHKRRRLNELACEISETLKWWLLGKFFGMTVIGILTMLGLTFLDVPLALALSIIAALFTFIPNVGPILSALPALLLGIVEGPQQAIYIGLLYLGIQTVESYFLTPMVQRKTIDLPPALTLSAQVIFGYTVGGIGIAFATPFTAIVLVTVRMLYIEDQLGDKSSART